MIIRQGFVSNSSSTSFINIVKGTLLLKNAFTNQILEIGNEGHTEFGWETTTYDSPFDRINFAYIQAMSTNNVAWIEALYETIKEHTNCSDIVNNLSLEYKKNKIYAYIDHQSCATEGQNTEIFDSKENLLTFLFSDQSYIESDNDNH